MLNRDFDVRVAHEQAHPNEGEMLRVCVTSAAPCDERFPRGCSATSTNLRRPVPTENAAFVRRLALPWPVVANRHPCLEIMRAEMGPRTNGMLGVDNVRHGIRPSHRREGRPYRHIHQDCRWPCTSASEFCNSFCPYWATRDIVQTHRSAGCKCNYFAL